MSLPYNTAPHGTWAGDRSRRAFGASSYMTPPRSSSANNSQDTKPSDESNFPILVTTVRSARHELLFVNPNWSFSRLGSSICDVFSRSPNCSSHVPAGSSLTHLSEGPAIPPGKIRALRVRWARDGARDAPGWPELTVVTEENHTAVMTLVWQRMRAGRSDVLEAEPANWGGEEGLASGGERLPSYGEVDWGLA